MSAYYDYLADQEREKRLSDLMTAGEAGSFPAFMPQPDYSGERGVGNYPAPMQGPQPLSMDYGGGERTLGNYTPSAPPNYRDARDLGAMSTGGGLPQQTTKLSDLSPSEMARAAQINQQLNDPTYWNQAGTDAPQPQQQLSYIRKAPAGSTTEADDFQWLADAEAAGNFQGKNLPAGYIPRQAGDYAGSSNGSALPTNDKMEQEMIRKMLEPKQKEVQEYYNGRPLPVRMMPDTDGDMQRKQQVLAYLQNKQKTDQTQQKTQAEIGKLNAEAKNLGAKPQDAGAPVAIIGENGKPILVTRQNAIGREPYSPSIAGAAQFSPEALRLTAEQFLAGDKSAVQGYARNATARIALQNEITKVAKEQGMDGKSVAAQMSEFQGMMAGSRAVGTRTANIEMAADEAKQLMPIALEASRNVVRSGILPFGKVGIMFDDQTNDPNLRAFAVANNGLINTYARAITPTGVVTQADKEHARDLLSTAFDQKSYEAAVKQMEVEMDAALAAPGHVRKAMTSAITGTPTKGAQPTVGGARAQGEALFTKSKDRIAAEKWLQDNPFHPKYDKVKSTLGSM